MKVAYNRVAVDAFSLALLCVAGQAYAGTGPTKAIDAEIPPQNTRMNEAGTPAPNETLHLVFSLTGAKVDALKAYAQSATDPKSPNFRHWLTPKQVGQKFGAPQSDVNAVIAYARSQGFTVKDQWENRMFVSVDAPVAKAEAALNVKVRGFERPPELITPQAGSFFYAPNKKPELPESIATKVGAVIGLSNMLAAHPGDIHQDAMPLPPTPDSSTVLPTGSTPSFSSPMSPNQISTFYNVDQIRADGWTGSGQWVAIYSPTQVNYSDVYAFAGAYGLSGYGVYYWNVDGGATDNSGQVEACLDGEVILGQARQSNILYFQGPNTGSGALDTYNFIAARPSYAPVLSDSWGWSESYLKGFPSFLNSLEAVMAQLTSEGVAHYNSSGDNGAGSSPGYPSSSPNVTGVGGTDYIVDSSGSYSSEQGWSGSGGGLSTEFARPSWQTGPGVANGYSTGYRQVPDVSAAGGPNPGYNIYTEGSWWHVWGTSASTPLWASVHTLLNQAHGSSFGNLNAYYYYLGTNLNDWEPNAFVFHDLTAGNNGYPTTSKWDYVTGWGSANFGKLYADIFKTPDLMPYNPGWKAPVILYKTAGVLSEPATLHETLSYYFAEDVLNNGPADSLPNYENLKIDGVSNNFYTGPYPSGWFVYAYDLLHRSLAAGTHTLELDADSTGMIGENNEGNNVYHRTITVLPGITSLKLQTVVVGGQDFKALAYLSSGAPAAGAKLSFTSSNPAIVPNVSSTLKSGAKSLLISLATKAVTKSHLMTIKVTYGDTSATATVTVKP